jgi:signal recognition particle subunit SRP54
MLENLTQKITQALSHLGGAKKLTEANIADALKEVRQALLSADVHFKVAKEFIQSVQSKCVGQSIIESVSARDQVIKIINDSLVELLGSDNTAIEPKKPLRIMMIGLHGAGKTTSSAKLARLLKTKSNYKPALIACDIYRPAAIDQLDQLARNEGFIFHADRDEKDVSKIATDGLAYAKQEQANCILFDTAGRLQIDTDLISEIQKLKSTIQPDEIFLVADSALGQEAVNIAKSFHEAVHCTGIILTKLDGDARGGAALSMKAITGIPIKFIGTGEKTEDFEHFHPDRIASRILGMGDVVSLVEKAQENIDQAEAEKLAKKMQGADFNLEDFLKHMQQIKKMGSMSSIVKMVPGMSGVEVGDKEEKKMARTEAIILSMTRQERRAPRLLRGSRLSRIAKGSGTQVRDVNALLKQFSQMQKMMRMMKGSKGKRLMSEMKNKMGDSPNSSLFQ